MWNYTEAGKFDGFLFCTREDFSSVSYNYWKDGWSVSGIMPYTDDGSVVFVTAEKRRIWPFKNKYILMMVLRTGSDEWDGYLRSLPGEEQAEERAIGFEQPSARS